MRFLSMIALLAFLGCAGNNKPMEKNNFPSCEIIFEEIENRTKRNNIDKEKFLKIFEEPLDSNVLCRRTCFLNNKKYCFGNVLNPIPKQENLPTCETFYNFHEKLSKSMEMELDWLLKQLEIPPEWPDCNNIITCNEKTYCVDPMIGELKLEQINAVSDKCRKISCYLPPRSSNSPPSKFASLF